jgi:hypothetical protein
VEYSQQFKITGIVIIIDGVEYNRENTSLENPAVINEESIVEIKAFGKNLDSASPSSNKGVAYDENGYSPLHKDWNWVFNEDNTEATAKINASQFSIVLESLEITYCNDGRIWQGSGVYIIYEEQESDQK